MTQISVLPVAVYAAGVYTIAATAIADSVTSLQIAVQRCTTADPTIWPLSTSIITFDLQTSVDGGVSWQSWNSPASGSGGIATAKGVEQTSMYVAGTIPAGTSRNIKGSITLSASIKTSATITVL